MFGQVLIVGVLVRVPRESLRYATSEEERRAHMRRTWENELERDGVLTVGSTPEAVDIWRAVFSAEAALRIARRYEKRRYGARASSSHTANARE